MAISQHILLPSGTNDPVAYSADSGDGLKPGELGYRTDTHELFVGEGTTGSGTVNNLLDPLRTVEVKTDTTAAADLTVTTGAAKTMVLATSVWDDFPPCPIIVARLGANAPTLAALVSNVSAYTFDATNDEVFGATEIPHGWKEGTTIYPHIHWATNGVDGTARGVKWQLEYTVGDHAEAFGAMQTITVDATIDASTTDRTYYISDFTTTIAGTNLKIGAYIQWRLTRIATAHANGAPSADPFALAIGFHGEHDTVGSRAKGAKT